LEPDIRKDRGNAESAIEGGTGGEQSGKIHTTIWTKHFDLELYLTYMTFNTSQMCM